MTGGLTRRRLLAAAFVAGIAGATGGFMAVADRNGVVRTILHRLLGPFEIPDADFDAFVGDLAGQAPLPDSWEADALTIIEHLPEGVMGGLLPAHIDDRRVMMERAVLAEFMLATDIQALPKGANLRYRGLFSSRPCVNPFARFD